MRHKILFALVLATLLLGVLSLTFFLSLNLESTLMTKERIVTMVILLDFNTMEYDSFHNWFQGLESNYTFVLLHWESLNSTQINWLQSQAELIPCISRSQIYNTAVRASKTDTLLNNWNATFGSYPKGIFSFQPDTYLVNYTNTNYGVEYWQGYCFDQYVIDRFTERGGWQLPYYAREDHVLVPNNVSGGVVIYPHLTWDWIDSFTLDHEYSTHPLQRLVDDNDISTYVLNLITTTLDTTDPFGYATFMFEYGWVESKNKLWIAEGIIKGLTSDLKIQSLTLEDCNNWFTSTYTTTPTYRVKFSSPNSGKSIEWYYSTSYRVARADSQVVSFIDYENQESEIYLIETANINTEEQETIDNDIDNSLTFIIDALGGAGNRAPIKTNGVQYPPSEDLADFPTYYYSSR